MTNKGPSLHLELSFHFGNSKDFEELCARNRGGAQISTSYSKSPYCRKLLRSSRYEIKKRLN